MIHINNAGFFGEIEVTVRLLDYLTYVDGLEETQELRRFLVDAELCTLKTDVPGTRPHPENLRAYRNSSYKP